MIEIVMPRLSDSMEQGTIVTWLKHDGDEIIVGDELVEIETDKATMPYRAEVAGVLRIIAAAGDTLAVGEPIAGIRPLRGRAASLATESRIRSDPERPTADEPAPPTPARGSSPGSTGALAPTVGSVRVTPLARRVARTEGIALDQVVGTGLGGRVTRSDVVRIARAATAATQDGGSMGTLTTVELSRLQTVIARRMSEATATVPQFQIQVDVVMDRTVALRNELTASTERAPSLTDFVVKAAALALRTHPLANGSYRDGHLELHSRINIRIAVAADNGLLVPTIFDADQKSLSAIAADTRRLAERARSGTVTPPDLAGGTFTVSNLGMYGMTVISPVVNPPQAAILGVGCLRQQLTRVGGEIVEQQVLALTLNCDHRILYGADAARFLSEIRANLEQPLRLAA